MRIPCVAVMLAMFLATGFPFGPGYSTARTQTEALTVGAVLQQGRGLVKDLDDRASALLRQGNSVAAQQQMLLAGLIKGTVDQLQQAYARQMNATVDRLMGAEKEAFTQFRLTLEHVEHTTDDVAEELSRAIRQAHSAATEVLSRVPFADKYPVIHGLVTRDILADLDEQPDDLLILGFFLLDPVLNELPEIWVNGTRLTTGVSAYFDRIQIQLPPRLKANLRIANTPCAPRQTFSVWMRVTYNKRRGFWPATWKQRATLDRNMIASPGEVQYEVTVLKSGITMTTSTVDESFRAESPNFNWGCEENSGNHADFTIPEGHTLVEKHAGWADLGGRWENHSCSVSHTGNRVVGSCSVRGGNRSWGQCSGGGHGRVAVWGKTRKNVSSTTPFNDELVRRLIMRGSERHDTIELASGQHVTGARVEMRRINAAGRCEALADDVNVTLDPELGTTRRATSTRGMFDVSTDGTQLSIRRR